jgi:hypothetical protein
MCAEFLAAPPSPGDNRDIRSLEQRPGGVTAERVASSVGENLAWGAGEYGSVRSIFQHFGSRCEASPDVPVC